MGTSIRSSACTESVFNTYILDLQNISKTIQARAAIDPDIQWHTLDPYEIPNYVYI